MDLLNTSVAIRKVGDMKRTITERLAHLKDTFDKARELEVMACKMFNKESDNCDFFDGADPYALFNESCTHPDNSDTRCCCIVGCPLRKE